MHCDKCGRPIGLIHNCDPKVPTISSDELGTFIRDLDMSAITKAGSTAGHIKLADVRAIDRPGAVLTNEGGPACIYTEAADLEFGKVDPTFHRIFGEPTPKPVQFYGVNLEDVVDQLQPETVEAVREAHTGMVFGRPATTDEVYLARVDPLQAAVNELASREINPKDAAGSKKVPMHLLPFGALAGVLKAFAEGARKYGAFNWRDTPIINTLYYAAAIRHIAAALDGEDIDPESGDARVAHIDAAIAGLLIERDALANGTCIDGRHKAGVTGDLIRAATRV
jgi:hypothetical protein